MDTDRQLVQLVDTDRQLVQLVDTDRQSVGGYRQAVSAVGGYRQAVSAVGGYRQAVSADSRQRDCNLKTAIEKLCHRCASLPSRTTLHSTAYKTATEQVRTLQLVDRDTHICNWSTR